MSDKILSIIIPCFNKYNFTKSCLDDVSQLPEDHEIIIVDNGSTDQTVSLAIHPRIIYLDNATNLGFAKACNQGYATTNAPNVLFLNNDIRVKSDFTTWTQSLIDKCPTGLVSPTMGLLNDKLYFVKEANEILIGNCYLSGWCLAGSKDNFNKLILKNNSGPFDESFFCYFEDTDLSFRAKQLNIPLQVAEVPVVHFGKTSSKQLNVPQLYKNARQIFLKKWKKLIK